MIQDVESTEIAAHTELVMIIRQPVEASGMSSPNIAQKSRGECGLGMATLTPYHADFDFLGTIYHFCGR
jgi:hypothetical protein